MTSCCLCCCPLLCKCFHELFGLLRLFLPFTTVQLQKYFLSTLNCCCSHSVFPVMSASALLFHVVLLPPEQSSNSRIPTSAYLAAVACPCSTIFSTGQAGWPLRAAAAATLARLKTEAVLPLPFRLLSAHEHRRPSSLSLRAARARSSHGRPDLVRL